jgi:hypothetical protein
MKRVFSPRFFGWLLKGIKQRSELMQRVIQTDDMLEIGVQLTKPGNEKFNRKKSPFVNLKPNFIDIIQSQRGASSEVKSYRNKIDRKIHISIKAFKALDEIKKTDFESVRKYYCKLNEYTFVEYFSNSLSIRIHNLSYCDKSRFRQIMQVIADSELFKFKHRTTQPTNIQIFDATRSMLDRRFNIRRYEWGLIFNHEISLAIHSALNRIVTKNIPGVRFVGNTVYLHESKSYKIKIYNITVADDKTRRSEEPEFKSGDRLKFEITYKSAYLTRQHLKIHHLKTQNLIADLFSSDNERLFKTYFLNRLVPLEKRNLFKIAKVDGESDFLKLIRNSLVETSAEKILAEFASESEQLMRSLDRQYTAQTDLVDDDLISDIKKRNRIPMFEKDTRKVRSGE